MHTTIGYGKTLYINGARDCVASDYLDSDMCCSDKDNSLRSPASGVKSNPRLGVKYSELAVSVFI